MIIRSFLKKMVVPAELESRLNQINKPVGVYGYDPWGYSTDSFMIGMSLFKWFYDHYFRVKTHGLENIPKQGRALVISNHGGQLPMDGALIGFAIATSPHGPRAPRAMVERFFPTVPFIGNLINQVGGVIGDPLNCIKMLNNEELVIVFPEGVRGSGKLFKNRYTLQRFGNGFMHIAMTTHTPIVPVGVVGCEETMPSLYDIKPLARMLGIPYAPVTIPFPLPCKVTINFGKPMMFTGDIDNEESVTKKVEEVKKKIMELIKKGLSERKGIFYG